MTYVALDMDVWRRCCQEDQEDGGAGHVVRSCQEVAVPMQGRGDCMCLTVYLGLTRS